MTVVGLRKGRKKGERNGGRERRRELGKKGVGEGGK